MSYNTAIAIQNNSVIQGSTFNSNLLQHYLSYLDIAPKSVETYNRALTQLFRYLQRNCIENPTRKDIVAWREELKEAHKPSTVQNYITATKIFFAWCEQEHIYSNITDHLKGAKISREHKKDYLTAQQVREVIANIDRSTVKGVRDYAIFLLMVNGGLRDIEVQRANIEDLTTKSGETVLYLQGKDRDERADFVIIDSTVEHAIRQYLKTRKNTTGKDPLFVSCSNHNTDGRLTTRAISGIIKSALVSAGFDSDRLTAHSLRHTAVTLALMQGATLQEAQQFARHSNLATTEIYAHNLDRINNRCGAWIMGAIYG